MPIPPLSLRLSYRPPPPADPELPPEEPELPPDDEVEPDDPVELVEPEPVSPPPLVEPAPVKPPPLVELLPPLNPVDPAVELIPVLPAPIVLDVFEPDPNVEPPVKGPVEPVVLSPVEPVVFGPVEPVVNPPFVFVIVPVLGPLTLPVVSSVLLILASWAALEAFVGFVSEERVPDAESVELFKARPLLCAKTRELPAKVIPSKPKVIVIFFISLSPLIKEHLLFLLFGYLITFFTGL
jgi:hypothetical protein